MQSLRTLIAEADDALDRKPDVSLELATADNMPPSIWEEWDDTLALVTSAGGGACPGRAAQPGARETRPRPRGGDRLDRRRKVHLPWKLDHFRHRVAAI